MLLWFRSFNRRRRVARYEREYGNNYPFRSIRVTLPKDLSFDVKNALLRNKYETEESGFIEEFLPADGDVIELGGSVGVIAAFTRSRLQPSARQVVVEANPALAEICRRNVASYDANGTSTVIEAALSYSGQETVSFFVGDNPHVGRLGGGADGRTITVPVTRLEDICADHGIGEFTLICDIEGAEVDMIERSEIWKTRCRLIIMETHPDFYDNGVAAQSDLIARILQAGFVQLGARNNVYAFGKTDT